VAFHFVFRFLTKFKGLEMTKITIVIEFWYKDLQLKIVYLKDHNS